MSNVFTIFSVKNKASKPTRFRADKIQERSNKPEFLKIRPSKDKGILETANPLTGTLTPVINNILKQKVDNDVNKRMYYNVTLMVAGKKGELEKFLIDNLPSDTLISPDLRDANSHMGDIANFNIRWISSDLLNIKDLNSAISEFSDYKNNFDNEQNYIATVEYYYNQFADYFNRADEQYGAAKKLKQENVLTFEKLRESLGPFKYADTGLPFLQYVKNHMSELKKNEAKKSGDLTFNKYFFAEQPNGAVRVKISNNTKTGTTSLTAEKVLLSGISTSAKSKVFKPFPTMFPYLFFSNDNVYDQFMRDLRNNLGKVANTLSNAAFNEGSFASLHIRPDDSEADKFSKVDGFLRYLEEDYIGAIQSRQMANQNAVFRPTYNVNASTLRM